MMTPQEFFEKYVHFYGLENKYVYLKEDDQGRYIEYVYQDGAPHDNRCLSWYEKPHPEYAKKHPNHVFFIKPANDGTIYRLREFSCGHENEEGDEKCCAGHPCKRCEWRQLSGNWTYDEPIKCACWFLEKCDFEVNIPSKDIEDFYKFIKQ